FSHAGYRRDRRSVALTCVCPLNWRKYESTSVEFRNAVSPHGYGQTCTTEMVVVQVILKCDPTILNTCGVVDCGYDPAALLFGGKPFHEHIVSRRNKQV